MRKSLVVLILCASNVLLAQGYGRRPGAVQEGNPGAAGPGMGRTVTGAPYSGVEVRETSQRLANGNTIDHKTETTVYRDSSGRTRTETTVTPRVRPGQTSSQAPYTLVTIHDLVAGMTHELNTSTKTDRQIATRGRGRGANTATPAGGGRGGRAAGANTGTASADPNVVRESLAMQTVNGVQATGTRVTHTIPAGQRGNAQAIQSVHEVWTSPDLKIPVMVKDSDPRTGTHITQLTNVSRGEPDPSLFQAPSDYKVIEVRYGRPGRGGGR